LPLIAGYDPTGCKRALQSRFEPFTSLQGCADCRVMLLRLHATVQVPGWFQLKTLKIAHLDSPNWSVHLPTTTVTSGVTLAATPGFRSLHLPHMKGLLKRTWSLCSICHLVVAIRKLFWVKSWVYRRGSPRRLSLDDGLFASWLSWREHGFWWTGGLSPTDAFRKAGHWRSMCRRPLLPNPI